MVPYLTFQYSHNAIQHLTFIAHGLVAGMKNAYCDMLRVVDYKSVIV